MRLEIVARNNAERLAAIVPPHAIYFMPPRHAAVSSNNTHNVDADSHHHSVDVDDELNDKTGSVHSREKIELMVMKTGFISF